MQGSLDCFRILHVQLTGRALYCSCRSRAFIGVPWGSLHALRKVSPKFVRALETLEALADLELMEDMEG